MADYAVNIVLRAQDEATPIVRRLVAETKKIRSVRGGGTTAAGGRDRGIMDDFNASQHRAAARLAGASANIGRLSGMARSAIGAPLELAMNFEQAMTEVRAVTSDATIGNNFDLLSEKARQLGRDTEFTASEVASGLKYMGIAGWETSKQLATLSPMLDAATVSGLDLGRTSDVITDVMGGFGLVAGRMRNGVDEARFAVDTMVATTLNANTNLDQLAEGLFKVGPLAAKVGVDFNEVNALLGVLANAGIKGSEGGTALRNMMLSLSGKPSKDMRQLLRQLGLNSKELRAELGRNGIAGAMGLLQEQMKDMPPEMQLFASNVLFGRRTAVSATNILGKMGTELVDLKGKLDESAGASAKAAAEFRSTHKSGATQLKSAIEDLGITIGDELTPVVGPMIEDAKSATKAFAAWAKEHPELIKQVGSAAIKLAALGTVLSPLLLAASSLTSVLALGSYGFKLFGGSAKLARGALGGLRKVAATTGPAVGDLIGSRAGFLGVLGAAAAAGAAGYAFGSWADDTFHLSDQMAGLNTEMSIHNELLEKNISLQVGLSKRGGSAALGSLTEQERAQLEGAKKRKEALSAELADNSGDFGSMMLGSDKTLFGMNVGLRGSDAIGAEIQQQQAIIDRINAAGIEREQRAKAQGLGVDTSDPRIMQSGGAPEQALIKAAEALAAAAERKGKLELTVRGDGAKVGKIESGDMELSVETAAYTGAL